MPGKIIIVGFDDSHDKLNKLTTRHKGIRGVVGMSYSTSNEDDIVSNKGVILTTNKYVLLVEPDNAIKKDIENEYEADGPPRKVLLRKIQYLNQLRADTKRTTEENLTTLSESAREAMQQGSNSDVALENAFEALGLLEEVSEPPA